MERHDIVWEHKGTHEKHLSVLDYKKQEREKEVVQLGEQIAEKQDEFKVLTDRVRNYDKGVVDLQRLEEMLKRALAKCFEAWDSYYRLNITNGNLHRENERLTKINAELTGENENLREQNQDYKLLRKAFGNRQVDGLVAQAKEMLQSKKRERFRDNKYGR